MTEKFTLQPEMQKIKNIGGKPTPEYNGTFDKKVFSRTQIIQQRPGESSEELHERLRPIVRNSFEVVKKPTKVKTHSWYTFDANHILGEDTFVLSTSTCKHEIPFILFVGKREPNFQQKQQNGEYEYTIYPLDRELTDVEKDRIYDEM